MKKGLKIFLIIFGVLIVANFSALDFFSIRDNILNNGKGEPVSSGIISLEEQRIATDSCGLVCQQTIVEKIKEELSRLPSPAGQSSMSPVTLPKTIQPTNGKPKVVYIPLTTDGTTVATGWTNIIPSDFYFDLSNYPGAKEVRFEVYLLALHGSAKVYARLYDNTNLRGVDYSELSTQNDSFTRLESSALTIWRGNNKYTVQLRSENGTEVQLKDAKLKILY